MASVVWKGFSDLQMEKYKKQASTKMISDSSYLPSDHRKCISESQQKQLHDDNDEVDLKKHHGHVKTLTCERSQCHFYPTKLQQQCPELHKVWHGWVRKNRYKYMKVDKLWEQLEDKLTCYCTLSLNSSPSSKDTTSNMQPSTNKDLKHYNYQERKRRLIYEILECRN